MKKKKKKVQKVMMILLFSTHLAISNEACYNDELFTVTVDK